MVNPEDLDIDHLATLTRDELEKRLMDWNAKATACYRFDENEQAEEYAKAAYNTYLAIQRKKGEMK